MSAVIEPQTPSTALDRGPVAVTAKPALDPAPIALAAFASSTLVLSAVNAQLVDHAAMQAVIASAWVMGGLVQFVVGVYALTAGRLFAAIAFMSYGGFWLSFAAYDTFYVAKILEAERGHATAWFLAPWLVFTLILFLAALRTNLVLLSGVGLLVVIIAALIVGQAQPSEGWLVLGGWLGIALAVEMFYLAAAELINQVYGRHVLPIGELGA